MKTTSVEEFYNGIATSLPAEISKEPTHFNVFRYEDVIANLKIISVMLYNRRVYYKISWLRGRYKVEYADKVIEVEGNTLSFATPKILYYYLPQDEDQLDYFCIFTNEFLG